jgi:parallel beta-helix repeat protein
MKRVSSTVLSFLLLASTLAFSLNTQNVKASGTIYIRADGSVYPDDGTIIRDGDLYTLTQNITSDTNGIVIERNNMTLDGAGHTLQGLETLTNGTYVIGKENITIRNMIIQGFGTGIVLDNSTNNKILENCITSEHHMGGMGIHLAGSSNNSIIGNYIDGMYDDYGIYLYPSSNCNEIIGNNITTGAYGILTYFSSNNSICNNNITTRGYGIAFVYGSINFISGNMFRGCGIHLGLPYENTVEGNSVNGKPLVFLKNMSDYTVDNAGQVILVGCNNIRVENLNLSDTTIGLELWETNNSRVSNNNITANKVDGIFLRGSSNNTIEGNNVTGNLGHGINFYSSSYNTLRDNNLADNFFSILVEGPDLLHFVNDIDISNTVNGRPIYYWIDQTGKTIPSDAGYVALVNCTNITVHDLDLRKNAGAVLLVFTANSTITRNNMTANDIGIHLINSTDNSICDNDLTNNYSGILLRDSSNDNIVEDNNMTGNYYSGIVISSSSCNTISGNNVTNNWYGIVMKSSSNNSIHHNNFFDNPHQFYTYDSTNTWDDGYPSGGNYWSNYSGVDVKRGPGQDLPGSDGIGDTPYVIDSDDQDRYPIVHRDVAVLNVVSSKTVVGQNYSMNESVTVENQGDYTETFNVTVYANETIPIEIVQLTLTGETPVTVDFTWNTTGFTYGNYTISAYASPVEGETSTEDNTLVDGWVYVSIPGDINGDQYVNAKDAVILGVAFGSKRGEVRYTPNADINGDDWCNAKDAIILGTYFDQHW